MFVIIDGYINGIKPQLPDCSPIKIHGELHLIGALAAQLEPKHKMKHTTEGMRIHAYNKVYGAGLRWVMLQFTMTPAEVLTAHFISTS